MRNWGQLLDYFVCLFYCVALQEELDVVVSVMLCQHIVEGDSAAFASITKFPSFFELSRPDMVLPFTSLSVRNAGQTPKSMAFSLSS